jgi:hypothetical protein
LNILRWESNRAQPGRHRFRGFAGTTRRMRGIDLDQFAQKVANQLVVGCK